MSKVDFAVLSALPEELEQVVSFFNQNAKCAAIKIAGFDFNIYDYRNAKILVAHTGIGAAFASAVLTLIYSELHPEYVLYTGTAGGIKGKAKLRDVIVVEKAFEAEMTTVFQLAKGNPFEGCLTHPLNKRSFPLEYSADPELLKLFDSIKPECVNTYKGIAASSDAFPAPKELFERMQGRHPSLIDMETSAVYQIAWLLNAKALAIRGISNVLDHDGADENIHAADVKGSTHAACAVLLKLLDKLVQKHSIADDSEVNDMK